MFSKEVEKAIQNVVAARVQTSVSLGPDHPLTAAFRESEQLLMSASMETVGLALESEEGRQLIRTVGRSMRNEVRAAFTDEDVLQVVRRITGLGYTIFKEED
jgi:hypothetical protein